jgi:hypothetical protein
LLPLENSRLSSLIMADIAYATGGDILPNRARAASSGSQNCIACRTIAGEIEFALQAVRQDSQSPTASVARVASMALKEVHQLSPASEAHLDLRDLFEDLVKDD